MATSSLQAPNSGIELGLPHCITATGPFDAGANDIHWQWQWRGVVPESSVVSTPLYFPVPVPARIDCPSPLIRLIPLREVAFARPWQATQAAAGRQRQSRWQAMAGKETSKPIAQERL